MNCPNCEKLHAALDLLMAADMDLDVSHDGLTMAELSRRFQVQKLAMDTAKQALQETV